MTHSLTNLLKQEATHKAKKRSEWTAGQRGFFPRKKFHGLAGGFFFSSPHLAPLSSQIFNVLFAILWDPPASSQRAGPFGCWDYDRSGQNRVGSHSKVKKKKRQKPLTAKPLLLKF